jgi:hypothetical protein
MAPILARGARIAPGYLLGRAALARRGGALVLVDRGGEVRAPLTFSRAQAAGVEATGFDSVTWRSYGADIPRWVGAEARLLIGGQRTNLLADTRTVGRTGWINTGIDSAVGAVGPNGVSDAATLMTENTATSTHETVTGSVSLTSGLAYTLSALLLPGTCENVQLLFRVGGFGNDAWANFVLTGNGSVGTSGPAVTAASVEKIGNWYRCQITAPATATTTTSPVAIMMGTSGSNGRGPSFLGTGRTLTLAWPQLELGSFASTPILPPTGSPGASTRGTESLTAPLSSLYIADSGACTVLWRGAFSATNIGNSQTIAAIHDGTTANRCEIRLTSTGIPEVIRVTAGVVAQTNFGGAPPTPGATMRAGFTLDGAGRLAGVVAGYNGGAVAAVVGTATVGLSTFRHGTSVGNSRELWGETHTLTVMPPRSDAEMQALVAAL